MEQHAESMESLSKLAVDETSGRRGAFISVFFDAELRRLLFAAPGRNVATFKAFAMDLRQRGGAPEAIRQQGHFQGLPGGRTSAVPAGADQL